MLRYISASLIGLISVTGLTAGVIPIGLTNGLNIASLTPISSTSCTGHNVSYNPGFTNCIASPATQSVKAATTNVDWQAATYSSTIFNGTTNGGNPLNPALPIKKSTITDTNQGAFTFNTSSDGGTTGAQVGYADVGTNAAGQVVSGDYSLVIPVGIKGVDKVWTEIQDFWGIAGSATSVEFDFSNSSDGTGGITSDIVNLTYGSTIRSGFDCTGAAECALVAKTLSSSTFTNQGTLGDVSVSAHNFYTASYDATTAGPYAGSTGQIHLDDQAFNFGNAHLSQYLVQIIIKNTMAPNGSRIEVGAISVDQVTPEPSTIFMLLSGLGAVGFAKFRRRSS